MIQIKHKLILGLMVLLLAPLSYASDKDSLNVYLQIAAENNPDVRSGFANYKAAWQKVPQVRALEDPTLEVGFFFKPMDIVGGRQVADFTLMQMFPWFGTKKAARNEATHMAKMTYEQFRETRNNVFLQVYTQWYKMLALKEQLRNNQYNKELLLQLKSLALRRFSSPQSSATPSYTPPATTSAAAPITGGGMSGMSGMSSKSNESASSPAPSSGMSGMGSDMGSSSLGMSEVLRIELEILELDDNMETILANLNTEEAIFNTLLNRPIDSPILLPETIDKTAFAMSQSMESELIAKNPMLGMLEQEQSAYREMGKMNRRMSYPMLGIGVQYMLINKTSDAMLGMGSMNGDDMVMPMISISLPIYRGKYKAQQRESKWRQQMAQQKYISTLNNLNSQIHQAKNSLEDADRKILLYNRQSDLAQTTYNLGLKEFAVGKTDLTNLIQIHRQLLDYKLKEAQAIANYNTQVAAIQSTISFNYVTKED